jgi:hypothetical protein
MGLWDDSRGLQHVHFESVCNVAGRDDLHNGRLGCRRGRLEQICLSNACFLMKHFVPAPAGKSIVV